MKKALRVIIGLVICVVGIFQLLDALGGGNDAQAEAEVVLPESEYKAACQFIDYKELLRYPEKYEGAKICVKVKIRQVLKDGWRGQTDNDGYGWYFDDEYYLLDYRSDEAVKVLDDDIVLAYGEYIGAEEVTRALTGAKEEIPYIKVRFADIVEDKPEKSYEEILEEYTQKMRDATPGLIEEYYEEAKSNTGGLMGLAEISNDKEAELAEIYYEGSEEMSKTFMYGGNGSSEEHDEWTDKLWDIYLEEAAKIQEAYMDSAE